MSTITAITPTDTNIYALPNNAKLFPSSAVKIFPCSKTRTVEESIIFYPETKIVTEANFTNIPGILPGMSSYVIGYDNNVLRCVIKGYYIEVYNNIVSKINPANTIDLTDINLEEGYLNLVIKDNLLASSANSNTALDQKIEGNYYFTALYWTEDDPKADNVYSVNLGALYNLATAVELKTVKIACENSIQTVTTNYKKADQAILNNANKYTNDIIKSITGVNPDNTSTALASRIETLEEKLTKEITDRGTADSTILGAMSDNDTATTVYGVQKYAKNLKGTSGDNSTSITVYGVKNYAKGLLGSTSDSRTKNTIYGTRKYAEYVAETAKDDVIGKSTDNGNSNTIRGLSNTIADLHETIEGLRNRINILEIHTEDLKHSPIMAIDGLKAWVTATIIDSNSKKITYFQDAVSFEALSTFSFLPTLRDNFNTKVDITWYKDEDCTILAKQFDQSAEVMDLLLDRNFYAMVGSKILTCHLVNSNGQELTKQPVNVLYSGGPFPNPNNVFSDYGQTNAIRWYRSSSTFNDGTALTSSKYYPMDTISQSMHIYACINK